VEFEGEEDWKSLSIAKSDGTIATVKMSRRMDAAMQWNAIVQGYRRLKMDAF
jgi:hypothetical protein